MIKQTFEARLKNKILLISSFLIVSIYLFSSCSSNQYLYCGAGSVINSDFVIRVSGINYNAISDSIKILGEIQDSVTAESLVGVNVYIKNTTIGVSTYLDGKFKLAFKYNPNDTLKFSYIGYSYKSYKLKDFLKEHLRIK